MGRYLFLYMSEDKLFLIMMVENSNKDNADKKKVSASLVKAILPIGSTFRNFIEIVDDCSKYPLGHIRCEHCLLTLIFEMS